MASGRFDGPIYLEDAREIAAWMVASGRVPAPNRWVFQGGIPADILGEM